MAIIVRNVRSLAHVMKNAYLPGPFRKVYAVTILYGVGIGGFMGGMIAAGAADGRYLWVVALGIFAGAVVGSYLMLQLVPRRGR